MADMAVSLTSGCLALVGNGLVIAAFIKYESLRTRSTIALVSLALIDILLFPFSLLYFGVQMTHTMFTPDGAHERRLKNDIMNQTLDMDQHTTDTRNWSIIKNGDILNEIANQTGARHFDDAGFDSWHVANETGARHLDDAGFDSWRVACKAVAGLSEFLAVCDLLNVVLIATERFVLIH